MRLRDWHSTELSAFFKDTWKVTPSVTLNLGVHYEWFGVPYEKLGRAGALVGGAGVGLCGISCGNLTIPQFVGKNSPNPDIKVNNNDWNNLAPSFGLSWSLPWLGRDKTVLRVGYGWSIAGGPLKQASGGINAVGGAVTGLFGGSSTGGQTGLTYTQAGYLSMANLSLPIPQQFAPLAPVPLTGSRQETINAYDRRDPYIQNFNFEIQRELAQNFTMSVAYIGTKGTALWGGIPLNAVNIDAALPGGQTFLDAFNTTRTGGNAPLFDQMLRGLNVPGAGVVNGTTITGSAALRAYTATRAFVADGNAGGLADFLNRSTNITGRGGGFVRNSGLFPENFFVLNPQFGAVTLHANPGSSTHHALQVQLTKRLAQGFSTQTSYTWSRSLGESDNDAVVDYVDPRNRRLSKSLLGFHRTQFLTTNGTYELPFGAGRPLLSDSPAWVQRLVERWQFGGIFSWAAGAPLTVTAPVSTIWQTTTNMTPDIAGTFSKDAGKVTKLANGVTLFPGILQIADPARAGVSTANALQGSFSNKAITDAQGNLLLANPSPGRVGTLGLKWVEGPALVGFDANLIKRVRLTETKEFEFRVDAVNILNHPVFSAPLAANMSINSNSFGRITSAGGNRRFVINARLNF
jgi:hypothetical protein